MTEEEWQKFVKVLVETNEFGKLRMKEIHREVRAAGMQLLEGEEAHTRAGRVIEAGQRVGYSACDLHGKGEHPCGCLRYRNRVDKVGNISLDAQYESSSSAGCDDDR